jgi:tRNA modification GTPase
MTDTIFALSSGLGRAGIAVIRISGPDLCGFAENIINEELTPRHAYLVDLYDNSKKSTDPNTYHVSRITYHELIDQCIIIYFPSPNSFTGEDVVEIHSHGSPAVTQKIFEFLRARGMRMAEPGEFTRRAFDNGKMDLAEVDGLAALLDARTDRQRANALKSMTGRDSAVYVDWRGRMIEIAAYSAAMLDYPSDELPANIGEKLLSQTLSLHDEISAALSRASAARAVRSGFNIVLAGDTNAGKSSLFNALVGESRAIVSDIPGTTRDVVSAELDIDGYLVRLSDTAGLRETSDVLENIGIEKTRAEIENADLVIRVESGEWRVELDKRPEENEIIVINKCDLTNNSTLHSPLSTLVSALTGAGIPELLDLIKEKVHAALDGAESDVSVNARTKALLEQARNELHNAITNNEQRITNSDIFAEHVRSASDAIGRILGAISADEVMDATFGQLCLGK